MKERFTLTRSIISDVIPIQFIGTIKIRECGVGDDVNLQIKEMTSA